MNFKHIAAAAALLAAGSSFASSISTAAADVGLVLYVTNTVTNQSYDLDLGTSFSAFTAGNTAATATAQTWSLNDANWSSFFNAANSANYVWSVLATKSAGAISIAGNNVVLSTVTNGVSASSVTGALASQLSLLSGNIRSAAQDINAKAGTSQSFVATLGTDQSFVGGSKAGISTVDYYLNNYLLPANAFSAYNALGATAEFASFTNTGGKSTANVYQAPTVFAGKLAFTVDANGAATLAVTAVPEPETYGLALVGLLLAGVVARRRA